MKNRDASSRAERVHRTNSELSGISFGGLRSGRGHRLDFRQNIIAGSRGWMAKPDRREVDHMRAAACRVCPQRHFVTPCAEAHDLAIFIGYPFFKTGGDLLEAALITGSQSFIEKQWKRDTPLLDLPCPGKAHGQEELHAGAGGKLAPICRKPLSFANTHKSSPSSSTAVLQPTTMLNALCAHS